MNSPEILDKLQKSVQVSFASFSAFAEDSTGRCLSSESGPLVLQPSEAEAQASQAAGGRPVQGGPAPGPPP